MTCSFRLCFQHCRENTGGRHCNVCAEGYYGDPNVGDGCLACPCPETRKNFARGCSVQAGKVHCICKPGYRGPLCDRCEEGYFGDPEHETGHCEACDCNAEGSVSDACDERTGHCRCKAGVHGRKCDKCKAARHVLQQHSQKCTLCDVCTLTLLDKVDDLDLFMNVEAGYLANLTITAPWDTLTAYKEQVDRVGKELRQRTLATNQLLDRYNANRMDKMTARAKNILAKAHKSHVKAQKRALEATALDGQTAGLIASIEAAQERLRKTIDDLNRYSTSEHHVSLETALNSAMDHLNRITDKADEYFNDLHVPCSQTLFDEYRNLTKWIKYYGDARDELRHDIKVLNDRPQDMDRLQENVTATTTTTDALKYVSLAAAEHLKSKYLTIGELAAETKMYPYLDRAAAFDVLTEQIADNVQNVKQDSVTLKNIIDQGYLIVDEKTQAYNALDERVQAAEKHATNLLEKSLDYADLFKDSKSGSVNALKAR